MSIAVKSRALLIPIIFSILSIVPTMAPNSFGGSDATSSRVPSGETLNGKATYYPNSLNGHKTASGEIFHQTGNTAASNKLPLGTHVKVINVRNGESTDVKITDRGPKLGNRRIDLSKKAASEIGLTPRKGKVPVKIKVTRPPAAPNGSPAPP